jgi:hypothetical protein
MVYWDHQAIVQPHCLSDAGWMKTERRLNWPQIWQILSKTPENTHFQLTLP